MGRGRGSYPDDEHGEEEQEGDAGVEPCSEIGGFLHCGLAGEFPHTQDLRFGSSTFGTSCFDSHGVVLVVCLTWTTFKVVVEEVDLGARTSPWRFSLLKSDLNIGGDNAGEGMFVERVEIALKMFSTIVEDYPGFDVDTEGEYDSNPW